MSCFIVNEPSSSSASAGLPGLCDAPWNRDQERPHAAISHCHVKNVSPLLISSSRPK